MLRRCGNNLTADAAGLFGDDPERITLDGQLLSGLDLVIRLNQQLNEPATARDYGVCAVTDKDACILTGSSYRPSDDAMVLEDIHRPFHKYKGIMLWSKMRGGPI